MAIELHTPRLILQPLTANHADDLFHVFHDDKTLRYWHHPPHRQPYETTAMIWSLLAPSEACWWAMILRETGRAIGDVGYLGTSVPGMGYILHSDYWRQGYGTEAVSAALEYGFATLGLNRVELWINDENIASQRLAQKVGFRQRGQFSAGSQHNQRPHETLVYGLRADEWAARYQQPAAHTQREVPLVSVRPILPVSNVSETIDFYRDRLGFNAEYVGGDPPDFAIMSRGEWSSEQATIHFRHSDEPGIVHLYIMMGPYIDRLHEEYDAKGVTIARAPTMQPSGLREFAIEDNSGHRITFGANA